MKTSFIIFALKIDWPLLGSICLGAIVLAWVILTAVKGSADAATKTKTEPKPARPGDTLAGLGLLLVLGSLAYGGYTWLTFENTVENSYGEAIFNFALNNARNLRLGASGIGILCGMIALVGGKK